MGALCAILAHMSTRRTTELAPTALARWLSDRLEERNWGVRTLARRMTPADPEVARRALNRYLYEGSFPDEANRALIADALAVDPSEVPTQVGPFRRVA